MRARQMSNDGFTMVELLIALTLMTLVVSAVAGLAIGTDRLAETQPKQMDAQQRARVIAETLTRALRGAGAGVETGPLAGSLATTIPALWPRRVGRLRPDASTVARADVVTVMSVPDTMMQTRLAADLAAGSTTLVLFPCAGGRLVCRAAVGDTLAIFDARAHVDLVSVRSVRSPELDVRPLASTVSDYAAGAVVAEVKVQGYYFDRPRSQLRSYDSDGSDQPVVDDVNDLMFTYFGDPDPARQPRPEPGVANCLYDADGTWRGGQVWPAQADGLAALPLSAFTDGPWCGEGATVFDADLFRVRRVQVHLIVDDYVMVFDVTPPNLMRSPMEAAW